MLVPEEARLLIADEDDLFIFSDQMYPGDVSRLQQPAFWANYHWHCKCCIHCYVLQLLGEPDDLNVTSTACSKQD